jgi:hypothetical protein
MEGYSGSTEEYYIPFSVEVTVFSIVARIYFCYKRIYMPEGAEVPIQEKHKSLEAQEYQRAKQRIEASKRIAQELKRGGLPAREQNPTAIEVNRIFKEHNKPVSNADARIYDEQRIRMIYHAPNNQESGCHPDSCVTTSGETRLG